MAGNKKKKKKNQKNTFSRACSFVNAGENKKAAKLLDEIVKKDPGHFEAFHLLGIIALEANELEKAESNIVRAVNLKQDPRFYNNLGTVYKTEGKFDDAVLAYRLAIEMNPEYSEAYNNLGSLFIEQKKISEAIFALKKAVKLNPKFQEALYNYGVATCLAGNINESVDSYVRTLELNPDFISAHSNLLYTLHFEDAIPPQDLFVSHLNWADKFEKPLINSDKNYRNEFNPERILNIGFVSPDFCTHSVARFFEPLLENYNRSSLKFFLYSNTKKHDAVTERFRQKADGFVDITSINDEESAKLIENDMIDILIDLSGHTRGNRLPLFARKPAPVQISWLGYPDTTGLSSIDFRLTDETADPDGSDKFYSENLLRLPDIFLCFSRPESGKASEMPPCKKNGYITFGSFNNNSKISDRVIIAWSEILQNVENSVLKLKSASFADIEVTEILKEKFEKAGISKDRIQTMAYVASEEDHLNLYNEIDIALDTFPYNGTTTTCEALWMGVPVVCLKGNTHAARTGASILNSVGLKDLITEAEDDYVRLTTLLSNDIETIELLKTNIRSMMLSSKLMDSEGFAVKMEYVFRIIWKQTCSSYLRKRKESDTEAIFENNIRALKENHSYLFPLPDPVNETDIKFGATDNGRLILLIKGNDGIFRPVDDEIVSERINNLAVSVKNKKGRIITLMGSFFLNYADNIIEDAIGKNIIVLMEASALIFYKILQTRDFSRLFSNKRLRFCIAEKFDPEGILSTVDDHAYINMKYEFFSSQPFQDVYKTWYSGAKEKLERLILKKAIGKKTVEKKGDIIFLNTLDNIVHMINSRPFSLIKDKFKDLPCVVVASGPSLSGNISELKRAKGRSVIFAVDSALAPLLKENIVPDFVFSVDCNAFTYEKLAPYKDILSEISFVYVPDVTPPIMNNIKFKNRFYIVTGTEVKTFLENIIETGALADTEYQSVVHLAINAAQIAGCNPVVLTGLDLSFADNKDHAAGTILHWGNQRGLKPSDIEMLGNNGKMLRTSRGFVSILDICESLFLKYPERLYIDASEGGLAKKGCEVATLSDAVDLHMNTIIPEETFNEINDLIEIDYNEKILKIKSLIRKFENLISQTEDYLKLDEKIKKHIEDFRENDELSVAGKKILSEMNKLQSEIDQNEIIFTLNPLLSKYQDKFNEYELLYQEKSFEGDDKGAFMAAYEQQTFLHEIRKTSIDIIFKKLEVSLIVLSGFGKRKDKVSNLPKEKHEFSRLLFETGLLADLEDEIRNYSAYDPWRFFYNGAIYLFNNRIDKAEEQFQKAISLDLDIKKEIDIFKMKLESKYEMILKTSVLLSYKKVIAGKLRALNAGNLLAKEYV